MVRREFHKIFVETPDLEKIINEALSSINTPNKAITIIRSPGIIPETTSYLEEFFSSSLRYLGPLRDEPKSQYPLSPSTDPYDVGLKGENTAAVLELHKNTIVQYIPTSVFKDAEIKEQKARRTLETAVIDWLQYLDVAKGIHSQDKGKFGHEMKVQMPFNKRPFDLTHVGVGVSQVLPILVSCLLAEVDTTLIFEQPELHLHPKVQTLLGDFFLSMALLNKQCIIETHSEYLINRIRFRTAAAMNPENPWIEAVKVNFVKLGANGSEFKTVQINEYGAILDWPDGFFDQTQSEAEAILRSATQKRKSQKGN